MGYEVIYYIDDFTVGDTRVYKGDYESVVSLVANELARSGFEHAEIFDGDHLVETVY